MRRVPAFALLAVFMCTALAHAWAPSFEGESVYGFGARFGDPPRIGKHVRIVFSMPGNYGTIATGVARLCLPPGLTLSSGDTLYRNTNVGLAPDWQLVVIPQRRGDYEITGTRRITWPNSSRIEEADLVLRFRVEPDTAFVQDARLTRLETVRCGQRYRHGERYLVPIPGPQSVVQTDIEEEAKARPTLVTVATCSARGFRADTSVKYGVLLDAAGRLAGIRPLHPASRIPAALDSSCRKALEGWRFLPSRAKGKPVADWLLVDVPVRSGQTGGAK